MLTYKCKYCRLKFYYYDTTDFELCGEEDLWRHIQLNHEDVFSEVQNLETPHMLEECYD